MFSTMPRAVPDTQWKLNNRPSLWQQDWVATWVLEPRCPRSAQPMARGLFAEGKADVMRGARETRESIQAGACWASGSDKTLLFGNQNLPAILPRDMLGSQVQLSSSLPISVLFVSVGLRQQNPATAFTSRLPGKAVTSPAWALQAALRQPAHIRPRRPWDLHQEPAG